MHGSGRYLTTSLIAELSSTRSPEPSSERSARSLPIPKAMPKDATTTIHGMMERLRRLVHGARAVDATGSMGAVSVTTVDAVAHGNGGSLGLLGWRNTLRQACGVGRTYTRVSTSACESQLRARRGGGDA